MPFVPQPPAGKPQSFTALFAYISLALAGLMWTFPFLYHYHQNPITTFYQEWAAAVLGLAAMPALLNTDYWRRAEIPRIVLLPVGMLLLAVLQYALGDIPYFGQMLLYALYFMWAALLMMLGAHLRETLGLPAVATALAAFLLAGAELNVLAGLQQHYHFSSFLDRVVMPKVSPAVYGNTAQPNHYSDYLTLGLLSLGLLYARGALRAWQALLLALPILFVLPLSGSRTTLVYLGWLCLWTLVWQWRNRARRPLLYYSLLLLAGFGVMQLVIHLPGLAGDSGSVNTVERILSEDTHSGSIRTRLHLIREGWDIFTQYPLLGAGLGQYAWQHYLLMPQLHNGLLGLYNNAHNLVMHVAAETGLAGLLVVFGALALWLRRQVLQAERTIYHWWGYGLLAVLGIHSMDEYPLWYAYFLGIAALALGILDSGRYRLELGGVGRVFVVLTLALGSLSLYQLYNGYHILEQLEPSNPRADRDSVNRSIAGLEKLPLFQPYAALHSAMRRDFGPADLDSKLRLNTSAAHYLPIAATVYRQSLLLAQNGDLPAAKAEMERAIWSYPGDFQTWQGVLQQLAVTDAGHCAPLLEFAIQKDKEYHSALYTR